MTRQEFREMLEGGGFDMRPMPGQAVLAAQPTDYQIVDRETGAVGGEVYFDPESNAFDVVVREGKKTKIFMTEGES